MYMSVSKVVNKLNAIISRYEDAITYLEKIGLSGQNTNLTSDVTRVVVKYSGLMISLISVRMVMKV
jgi:hypothetical protein